MIRFLSFSAAVMLGHPLLAAEYHVSPYGNDASPGTSERPFRTIQHAAGLAKPGDIITVRAGTYRERINPPRSGASDAKRITYQAAPGEKVVIKGSEVITGWKKAGHDTWNVTLPNSFFGKFNPYSDLIHGDWFNPKNRQHHTGAVYLNGEWLTEAATLEEVLEPAGTTPLWFAQVDDANTTIWAQFKNADANKQLVEINVRQTVFYPDQAGRNFITVRGFEMRHAATPWAPPTAEQIGLIGTHWSKGWIIENCTISHSICSGISLGKHGDEFDNTSANRAEGYVKTIERAHSHAIPWTKENIGHHIVRNNTISHCEQTGIVGSLGCAFSTITGNNIHDIYVRRLFKGAEMAGIKLHGAVDVEISHNRIHHCNRGLWLDWMAQGTRVSRNLMHDNDLDEDLFVEVNHGPFLVDNNLFLSPGTLRIYSQGGAYVHNLMVGGIRVYHGETRLTPTLKPHSTEIASLDGNPSGDDRFYNNLMLDRASLTPYDTAKLPVFMSGNVFLAGAQPSNHEEGPIVHPDAKPDLQFTESPNAATLTITLDPGWAGDVTRKPVTTALLGEAAIPKLPYENSDGSPLQIDTDFFGNPRSKTNPAPGPFASPGQGTLQFKLR